MQEVKETRPIELKVCDASTDEQETTVSYGRKDGRAVIYSNDSTVLTKIQKLLNAEGTQWILEEIYWNQGHTQPSGYRFSCPKSRVKFSAKKKVMTEEQKAAQSARAKALFGKSESDLEEDED